MILADTSIWADHLRRAESQFGELLASGDIVMHPFVLGEIMLGYLRKRAEWLERLQELPAVHVAEPEEVLTLIESQKLMGVGIGYIDAHLLATVVVIPDCQLWTRDKHLRVVASNLGVSAEPLH